MASPATRVAVLGSTGSIGVQTLDVIARHPQALRLAGIAARTRLASLAEQWRRFRPSLAAVADDAGAQEFQRLSGAADALVGVEGLTALATHPDVDLVVVATAGRDALIPLVRAIQAGKRIALASKELLVMAGELLMRLVEEHGTSLMPIDSEHAGLFQCLHGVPREHVARLTVTGSGGPLWDLPAARLGAATREQVLRHPRWAMGPKITVDSATLMNKGLEVIEAHWLFGMPLERIEVLIHPEAAVHALVELIDGTWLAQMSPCDMRLPIQFALSFPQRWAPGPAWPRLSLAQLGTLRFLAPDEDRFPCLRLALEAARAGGTACAVLNGANDTAVAAYLRGELPFGEIPRAIAETMEQHTPTPHPSLDDLLAVDAWSRAATQELIHQWSPR